MDNWFLTKVQRQFSRGEKIDFSAESCITVGYPYAANSNSISKLLGSTFCLVVNLTPKAWSMREQMGFDQF